MIVTCQEGTVFRIHGSPVTVTLIATLFPPDPVTHAIEGPAVVPALFGSRGGEIWMADENANAVHAVRNTNPPLNGPYKVFLNILSHVSTEGVYVIPDPPCAYCGNSFYNAEQQQFRVIWAYPQTDFTVPPPGLGGNVLLVSEQGADFADTSLVTPHGAGYVQTSFGPRPPGVDEGSSMVDCAVPTATPTTTPTATFTPTARHLRLQLRQRLHLQLRQRLRLQLQQRLRLQLQQRLRLQLRQRLLRPNGNVYAYCYAYAYAYADIHTMRCSRFMHASLSVY